MRTPVLNRHQPLTAAIALALAVGSAHAATITITDNGDAGGSSTCTLRQAITAANTDAGAGSCVAGSGADTIVFDGLTNATITLAGSELGVTSDIDIQGSGQTIDAAGNSRSFSAYTASLGLSSLTLTGGSATGAGGGILAVYSSLTLSHVTVSGNSASHGGGIYAYGSTLALDHSTVSGNHASAGQVSPSGEGGGLSIKYDSNVTLTDSTVSGNTADISGGGIYQAAGYHDRSPGLTDGGTLTLVRSTVSGNHVSGDHSDGHGGIFTEYTTVSITDSAITDNDAQSYYGNAAGGITFSESIAVLDNSTISGNTVIGTGSYQARTYALAGGIYAVGSRVSLTNCTVAGNSADGYNIIAGGLSSAKTGVPNAQLTLVNTTVSANTANAAIGNEGAGGLMLGFSKKYGKATLQNTIISGNTGASSNDITTYSGPSATVTVSAAYSLLGSSLSGTYSGNGNQFSDNPGLGPLANNGGPTQTMLPQTGSLAIDHGSNALAVDASSAALPFDQRGTGYARITGGTVDIGAVEFGSAATGPAGPGGPSIPVPTLSTWAAALLASLLGFATLLTGRRRRRETDTTA